jgi:ABC-type sugar transport system ATPase subunit
MIRVERLCIRAGAFRLHDVGFEVGTGRYAILMGRTGSGKTTLLESLCGLRHVTSGRILLDGRDVTRLKPAERGIGLVPQDGALFPTMTVAEQMAFPLALRHRPPTEIRARVRELAELLEIGPLLDRRPQGLSGGERQRVALGRALSFRPAILCLDEPLSALDDATRQGMIGLLRAVRAQTGTTTLHITHNRSEAQDLGEVRFVLEDGRVREEGVGKEDRG